MKLCVVFRNVELRPAIWFTLAKLRVYSDGANGQKALVTGRNIRVRVRSDSSG